MRRRMSVLLASVLIVALCAANGSAQNLQENHYLVYETIEKYLFMGDFETLDQFHTLNFTQVEFDKFANPVMKNYEEYYDYGAHQTWYRLDLPLDDEWQVDLVNQFGVRRWYVQDAAYLVLPAEKTMPATDPGNYEHNHYLCYEVTQAPIENTNVILNDQFIDIEDPLYTVAAIPLFFCNPCQKWYNGLHTPWVDYDIHLAVYELQPNEPISRNVQSLDQFESWTFEVTDAIWLAVPTEKIAAVANEQTSWGEIKSMYR